jgi:hypothetical protein
VALERFDIRGPVHGLVGRCVWSALSPQLPRWIHKTNPSQDLCNKADSRDESPMGFVQQSQAAGLTLDFFAPSVSLKYDSERSVLPAK